MIAKARRVTRRWHGSYEPRQQKFIWGQGYVLAPQGVDHSEADRQAVKVHNHLKVCSCLAFSCGNPRRGGWYPKFTRAEQRIELELQEELDELRGWIGE